MIRVRTQHFRPWIANGTDALFVNQYGERLKPVRSCYPPGLLGSLHELVN